MKKITLALALTVTTFCLHVHPSDNQTNNNIVETFHTMLTTIWQSADFNKNLSVVDEATDSFAALVAQFSTDQFASYKKALPSTAITKAYITLCVTITNIAQTIEIPANLRPRHVRWLIQATRSLEIETARVAQKDITPIIGFTYTMTRKVFPTIAEAVGTRLQKAIDLLVFRPAEFYIHNWWWTIPLTAVGATGAYAGVSRLLKKAPKKSKPKKKPGKNNIYDDEEAEGEEKRLGEFVDVGTKEFRMDEEGEFLL